MHPLDRVLAAMRLRARTANVATCSACGRRVTDREEGTRLPGGSYVHLACATYRMRAVQKDARRDKGRRGSRPPAGSD